MITYIVIGVLVVLALLLCFALAVASFSFENYYENLKKTNGIRNSYEISTLEYVGAVNKKFFNSKLYVVKCAEFHDHYSSGRIALSEKTMYSNSLASFAIVSHELGHARQDSKGDKLKKHWRMRRTGKMLGYLFMPSILAGAVLSLLYVFSVLPQIYYLIIGLSCAGLGILIFFFAVFLKYKEIQIEKEATDFALEYLNEFLTSPEIEVCKDFLKSARLTYWASLFRTMLGWTFLTNNDNLFR